MTSAPEPRSLARPPALRPGDRLAVLCVSGPVDPEPLATGLDALRFAGLEPVTYPPARDPGTMRPYLAGDDAMRAEDLRAALTDPGIAGILFVRGGYGVAGIMTGAFADCGPRELIDDILAERLGVLGVPMITWAEVGHGGRFQTFPIGIAAELDAGQAELRLLDPPLS